MRKTKSTYLKADPADRCLTFCWHNSYGVSRHPYISPPQSNRQRPATSRGNRELELSLLRSANLMPVCARIPR